MLIDSNVQCPNCFESTLDIFYEVLNVPMHNVSLMRTQQEAFAVPCGDIKLGFCDHCGFISNTAFEPERMAYDIDYEESQGSSKTFQQFHRKLAETIVDEYHLAGKVALEIGCGKGEFLNLLIEAGCDHAIGFDPAFTPGRINNELAQQITIIAENFSLEKVSTEVDFICCKMTLEHISDTHSFVKEIRQLGQSNHNTPVFFMVPNMLPILSQGHFWDIYYEHCSYFTPASLATVFEQNNFKVVDVKSAYDDQYIGIYAEFSDEQITPNTRLEPSRELVQKFRSKVQEQQQNWLNFANKSRSKDQTIALWGGGSKAVAFISTMNAIEDISAVIDINPRKQGYYLPASGHKVIAPEQALELSISTIVVMNAIYLNEIAEQCKKLGIEAKLYTVDQVLDF